MKTKAKRKVQVYFQTRSKTRLCDSKIQTHELRTWMKCAKQTWKWIFTIITYANMKMKRTWQGYGARSCLRLVLNKLKEMKGPTPIYAPLET